MLYGADDAAPTTCQSWAALAVLFAPLFSFHFRLLLRRFHISSASFFAESAKRIAPGMMMGANADACRVVVKPVALLYPASKKQRCRKSGRSCQFLLPSSLFAVFARSLAEGWAYVLFVATVIVNIPPHFGHAHYAARRPRGDVFCGFGTSFPSSHH